MTTAWADLGLPCPLRSDYGWRADAGLSRTPFATALPEQAQVRTGRRHTFSLAWLLTRTQLALAEPYLLASAYDGAGITLELLTTAGLVTQTVRLAADLEVSPADGELFKLRATFETLRAATAGELLTCDDLSDGVNEQCEPAVRYDSVILATNLYPLEASDRLQAAARVSQAGLIPRLLEAVQTAAGLVTGTLVLTLRQAAMETDSVTTGAGLVNGLLYATLKPGYAEADRVTTGAGLVSGTLATTLIKYAHPGDLEDLTASARVTAASLEAP